MDASVGSPRHDETDLLANYPGERLLDNLLNRPDTLCLAGKTMEIGSVVGQI